MFANVQSRMLKSLRNRALALVSLVLATTSFLLAPAMAPSEVSAVQIERVQQASATTGAGATSLTLAWPAPTEDGNLLVLAVHVHWNATVGDIGVPAGWTLAERADQVGFRHITMALYYREGAPSQSGTVTVTALDSEDRIKMALAEYRGIRASGSLDQHAKSVGRSATPTSGTTSPTTQPDELWLGSIASDSGFDQCDPTDGFAPIAMSSSGASRLGLYERIVSANGTAGVAVTLRPSCGDASTISLDWAGVVATFRAGTPQGPQECAPIQLDECRVTTHLRGTPHRDRYNVRCRVQLAGGSNGIDPVAEGIRFVLTDGDSPPCTAPCVRASVAPRRVGKCWRYAADRTGAANIQSLKLCDIDPQRGVYRLSVRSRRANLQCLNGPAPYSVGLTIGDDCSESCSTGQCPTLNGSFPLGQCEANDPSYQTCPESPLCSCVGGSCTPPTSSGDSCQAQASSSGGAVFKCCDGATCGFDFSGSGGTCITCGTGATCSMYLGGSGGALVDCVDAAQCDVVVSGSGECRIDCGSNCRVSPPDFCCVTCASGSPVSCADGSLVCGRSCEDPTSTDTTCLGEWSTGYNFPQDIDVATNGSLVYVLDTGSDRVVKLDPSGNVLGQWNTGNPIFNHPRGIATDSMANVYVTNDEGVIRKYSASGMLLAQWGGSGSGDGQLASPDGIATDMQNNVYVAERYNHRVQKFDSSGGFLAKWGSFGTGNGQFDEPRDVAVDAAGNVFVFDDRNVRVQKFTSSGGFLGKWGTAGSGDGQFHISAAPRINVDPAGNLYVCDNGNSRIQKFSGTGAFLGMWGSFGSGDGQFNTPHGIAVDTAGNAYVVDYGNGRVQKCSSLP